MNGRPPPHGEHNKHNLLILLMFIHVVRMRVVWSVSGVPAKPSAAMEDTSASHTQVGQQCPGAVTRWSSGEVYAIFRLVTFISLIVD